MPKARIKSKLPIEIVVRADERHHTSVRKPRTHAYRRASEAPVSARAVAVIRPVPIIIALPLFLCTLSGKRQLHAYRYRFFLAIIWAASGSPTNLEIEVNPQERPLQCAEMLPRPACGSFLLKMKDKANMPKAAIPSTQKVSM
jgi:hypothetical protein